MRYLLIFLLLFSCDSYFKNSSNADLARVNDDYLSKSEVESVLSSSSNLNDSTIIINNYINNWAANKLLIHRALINLPEVNQKNIQQLADNYRNESLINSYIEALIEKNMNLAVSKIELDSLYETYKETFRLSEDLFKIRFIYLPKVNPDIKLFKSKIKRFNNDDLNWGKRITKDSEWILVDDLD